MFDMSYKVKKSKWVKDLRTRMRVFNGQIFDGIFAKHCKDNAEMNYNYLQKNYDRLESKAYFDESVDNEEFYNFCDTYDLNLDKLKKKELIDKKAFPPKD